jgi:hypothetical protein
MRRLAPSLFCALLTALSMPVHAQESNGPMVLRLTASTRALALGGVMPVGNTDSDNIFHSIGFAERLRYASAAVQLYGNSASFFTASAAIDWFGGAIAMGVRSLDYNAPAARPASDEADLLEGGADVIGERAATFAYSRRIKKVRIGLGTHLVEQRLGGEVNRGFAFDAGTGLDGFGYSFGLSLRNIGSSYEQAGHDVSMPASATITAARGGAYALGPIDALPVASIAYELDGDVTPAAGVEVSYWPVQGRTFTLRGGARLPQDGMKPFTAGAGFSGDRIVIDYAIVPFEDGSFSHRFGLRWR